MQQQHVDYKIAEALLKKRTNNAHQTWALNHRAWVDMVIHLPHDHGGFGIEGGVWRPKRLSVTALAGIYFFFKHRGSAATWRREDRRSDRVQGLQYSF